MGDPLSDPRAQRLLSADPGEVASLASQFHRVATQAGQSATALRGAHRDGTWTGAAAAAFRSRLGELPGQLDEVHGSYSDAATALDAYEAELADVQSAFRRLAQQLDSTRCGVARAEDQLATAQISLSRAHGGPHPSSAVQIAQQGVDLASSTAERIMAEAAALEAAGFVLLERFQEAREIATRAIASAGAHAPHQQNWWDRALGDAHNWLADGARAAHQSWSGFADYEGIPLMSNLAEHPGWKSLESLLGYLSLSFQLAAIPFALAEGDAEPAVELPEEIEGMQTLVEGGEAGADGAEDGAYIGETIDDLAHHHYRSAADAYARGVLAELGTVEIKKRTTQHWLSDGAHAAHQTWTALADYEGLGVGVVLGTTETRKPHPQHNLARVGSAVAGAERAIIGAAQRRHATLTPCCAVRPVRKDGPATGPASWPDRSQMGQQP